MPSQLAEGGLTHARTLSGTMPGKHKLRTPVTGTRAKTQRNRGVAKHQPATAPSLPGAIATGMIVECHHGAQQDATVDVQLMDKTHGDRTRERRGSDEQHDCCERHSAMYRITHHALQRWMRIRCA
eukprot:11252529-Alexandrium_andersonii.AAC.1